MANVESPQTHAVEPRVTSFHEFQSPHEASVDRLVIAIDKAYHRPWLMLWRSFWQGFMFTIGASVGSIVVFGLSVYVFQRSGGFELLKPFLDSFPPQSNSQVNPSQILPGLVNDGATSNQKLK